MSQSNWPAATIARYCRHNAKDISIDSRADVGTMTHIPSTGRMQVKSFLLGDNAQEVYTFTAPRMDGEKCVLDPLYQVHTQAGVTTNKQLSVLELFEVIVSALHLKEDEPIRDFNMQLTRHMLQFLSGGGEDQAEGTEYTIDLHSTEIHAKSKEEWPNKLCITHIADGSRMKRLLQCFRHEEIE